MKKGNIKKLLIVGDIQTGKSHLLHKINCDELPKDFFPFYYGYASGVLLKKIAVGLREVSLALWDTSANEEHERHLRLSYDGTHIVLICYAIDDPKSLENVKAIWYPEIKDRIPNAHYLLIGTKVDLRNENTNGGKAFVTYEDGLEMSKTINAAGFFECSVKDGMGIKEIRKESARIALGLNQKQSSDKFCSIL